MTWATSSQPQHRGNSLPSPLREREASDASIPSQGALQILSIPGCQHASEIRSARSQIFHPVQEPFHKPCSLFCWKRGAETKKCQLLLLPAGLPSREESFLTFSLENELIEKVRLSTVVVPDYLYLLIQLMIHIWYVEPM